MYFTASVHWHWTSLVSLIKGTQLNERNYICFSLFSLLPYMWWSNYSHIAMPLTMVMLKYAGILFYTCCSDSVIRTRSNTHSNLWTYVVWMCVYVKVRKCLFDSWNTVYLQLTIKFYEYWPDKYHSQKIPKYSILSKFRQKWLHGSDFQFWKVIHPS